MDYIDIKDLKEWDIIDKEYLIKTFWEQVTLWYCPETTVEEEIINSRKDKLLFPSPKEYFINLEKVVDKNTLIFLKNIFDEVNNYHKKNTIWYKENNNIKVLNTFVFWWYIFTGFIFTYTFWNELFIKIINIIYKLIKNILV